MNCSSISLTNISRSISPKVSNNPKTTFFFALGAIFLLAGVIGHYAGMNVIAVGVLTAGSGPAYVTTLISAFYEKAPLDEEMKESVLSQTFLEEEFKETDPLLESLDWTDEAILLDDSLIKVIEAGTVEDLRTILTKNPSLMKSVCCDETRDQPLHRAARLNKVEMVEELLKWQPDLFAKNGECRNAYEVAGLAKSWACASRLLRA